MTAERPHRARPPRASPPRGRLWPAVAVVCAASFAVLAVLVDAGGGGPLPGDELLHHWSLRHRSAGATGLARTLTATGTGAFPYLVALLAGAVAGRGRRGRLRAAAVAVLVLASGQAVRFGLMEALARARPPREDWAVGASGYSFPSGHSTSAALAAGLLCWALTRSAAHRLAVRCARALALAWAAVIGLSRVFLGVHWPSDVLGGWLLATAYLAALAAALARSGGAARILAG